MTSNPPSQIEALSLLQNAVGDGRIDLDEFDRRSAMLVESDPASTSAALAGLEQMAPGVVAKRDAPSAPVQRSGRRGGLSARDIYRAELKFEVGLWFTVSLVVLVIWGIVAFTASPTYFWPAWVIGPWGALLAARGAIEMGRKYQGELTRRNPYELTD